MSDEPSLFARLAPPPRRAPLPLLAYELTASVSGDYELTALAIVFWGVPLTALGYTPRLLPDWPKLGEFARMLFGLGLDLYGLGMLLVLLAAVVIVPRDLKYHAERLYLLRDGVPARYVSFGNPTLRPLATAGEEGLVVLTDDVALARGFGGECVFLGRYEHAVDVTPDGEWRVKPTLYVLLLRRALVLAAPLVLFALAVYLVATGL